MAGINDDASAIGRGGISFFGGEELQMICTGVQICLSRLMAENVSNGEAPSTKLIKLRPERGREDGYWHSGPWRR